MCVIYIGLCDACIWPVWYKSLTSVVHVSDLFGTCVYPVWYMCLPCVVHVSDLFSICVFPVWCMNLTCVVHVSYLYDTCLICDMCLKCVISAVGSILDTLLFKINYMLKWLLKTGPN